MNKKVFSIMCSLLLVVAGVCFFGFWGNAYSAKPIRIGILMPVEHRALRDIVAGFEQVVESAFPNSVIFNIQSAQGDIKLQRSIIELFRGQKMDMIAPIGTSATQMTLALVKERPIVSLAAVYSEEDRDKRRLKNITGVLDEISAKKKLDFIKAILPNIKMITLIFDGANEKTHKEIAELKTYGKAVGINFQTIMIQNLPELKTAGQAMAADSEAILILKDNLIASGIRLLISVAKSRHVPLITGDEGTVREGATLALGVRERLIGEMGGKLAVKILKGYPIQNLPMQEIQELVIFYNPALLKQQHIEITTLQDYARKNQYELINNES